MAVSVIGGKTVEPGENHRPAARHWQTSSQNCIDYSSSWAGFQLTTLVAIETDYICSWQSNYHTITTTDVAGKISVTEKTK